MIKQEQTITCDKCKTSNHNKRQNLGHCAGNVEFVIQEDSKRHSKQSRRQSSINLHKVVTSFGRQITKISKRLKVKRPVEPTKSSMVLMVHWTNEDKCRTNCLFLFYNRDLHEVLEHTTVAPGRPVRPRCWYVRTKSRYI